LKYNIVDRITVLSTISYSHLHLLLFCTDTIVNPCSNGTNVSMRLITGVLNTFGYVWISPRIDNLPQKYYWYQRSPFPSRAGKTGTYAVYHGDHPGQSLLMAGVGV